MQNITCSEGYVEPKNDPSVGAAGAAEGDMNLVFAIAAGAGGLVLILLVILFITCCRKRPQINLDDYIPKNQIPNWGVEKMEDVSDQQIEEVKMQSIDSPRKMPNKNASEDPN